MYCTRSAERRNDMTQEAIEARRAYKRQWAQQHPDKIREYAERHWTKKAEQMKKNQAEEDK